MDNTKHITSTKIKKNVMPDNSSPRLWITMAYLLCIIVSIAMIWYLLLSIFVPCEPCTEKTLNYILLVPFFLIPAYSGSPDFPDVISGKKEIMPDLQMNGEKITPASMPIPP